MGGRLAFQRGNRDGLGNYTPFRLTDGAREERLDALSFARWNEGHASE